MCLYFLDHSLGYAIPRPLDIKGVGFVGNLVTVLNDDVYLCRLPSTIVRKYRTVFDVRNRNLRLVLQNRIDHPELVWIRALERSERASTLVVKRNPKRHISHIRRTTDNAKYKENHLGELSRLYGMLLVAGIHVEGVEQVSHVAKGPRHRRRCGRLLRVERQIT